jgi:sugar/nucleoside kinase (ribokinase family)
MELSGCFFRPVRSLLGGNGVFFAESAKTVGFAQSYLIASVGGDEMEPDRPDLAASMAIESLNQAGVLPIVLPNSELPTGRVMILYQPDDRRFMVADRGANLGLRMASLPEILNVLPEQVDLLYVSGYSLLDGNQRTAVHALMQDLGGRGALIAVDMVPHDLFDHISLDTFREWTSLAHAVLAEASTVMGFMGLTERTAPEGERGTRILDALLSTYDFCLVRLNGRSDFLIADANSQAEVYVPYDGRVASLRFTDRVLASALFYYLGNNRSIPDSQVWVHKAIEITSDGRYVTGQSLL